jgi:ribosomal protein L29
MKKKEVTDLKTKDVKELDKKVVSLRLEIAKSKAETKSSTEKNLRKVKNLRKDLSQVLTIIREKDIIMSEEKTEDKKEDK